MKNNLNMERTAATARLQTLEQFFLLLNRFLRLSLNENLLLLNFLVHFFHLVPSIWEFWVLKVNSNLHSVFLHIQFTMTSRRFVHLVYSLGSNIFLRPIKLLQNS